MPTRPNTQAQDTRSRLNRFVNNPIIQTFSRMEKGIYSAALIFLLFEKLSDYGSPEQLSKEHPVITVLLYLRIGYLVNPNPLVHNDEGSRSVPIVDRIPEFVKQPVQSFFANKHTHSVIKTADVVMMVGTMQWFAFMIGAKIMQIIMSPNMKAGEGYYSEYDDSFIVPRDQLSAYAPPYPKVGEVYYFKDDIYKGNAEEAKEFLATLTATAFTLGIFLAIGGPLHQIIYSMFPRILGVKPEQASPETSTELVIYQGNVDRTVMNRFSVNFELIRDIYLNQTQGDKLRKHLMAEHRLFMSHPEAQMMAIVSFLEMARRVTAERVRGDMLNDPSTPAPAATKAGRVTFFTPTSDLARSGYSTIDTTGKLVAKAADPGKISAGDETYYSEAENNGYVVVDAPDSTSGSPGLSQ